jgi:tRNA G18 (ribose-2'-O)-methylase SpoU
MNKLYTLLKSLEERCLKGEVILKEEIDHLKRLLLRFASSDDRQLRHLCTLSKSFTTEIQYEDLLLFIVPIERILNKRVSDVDFGIKKKDNKNTVKLNELKIVLDNIRSAFNTGALIRTCEVLGVSEVLTTGYTQGFESDHVLKTSMGAKLKLSKFRDLSEVNANLEDYELVGLETSKRSKNIYKSELNKNTAFVVGNEHFGLSDYDLSLCDQVVHLPTFGKKNSLNVNAALSACGYEWVRRFL